MRCEMMPRISVPVFNETTHPSATTILPKAAHSEPPSPGKKNFLRYPELYKLLIAKLIDFYYLSKTLTIGSMILHMFKYVP